MTTLRNMFFWFNGKAICTRKIRGKITITSPSRHTNFWRNTTVRIQQWKRTVGSENLKRKIKRKSESEDKKFFDFLVFLFNQLIFFFFFQLFL